MSKQVVIVGAGVIGLSTAYYCACRGLKVRVIERQPSRRDGASYGNAGMIVPSHFIPLAAPGMIALGLKWMWNPASPFYIQPRFDAGLVNWAFKFWRAANEEHVRRSAPVIRDLSMASRSCFEEFAKETGADFGLVKNGLLMLCKSERALHEEAVTAQKARELNIPAEVLDAKRTAALDPGVTMDVAGSIYFPRDCHLSPEKFLAAIESELVRLGVKFLWENEATDFICDNARKIRAVMTTGQGEVPADEVVLCGGIWSMALAEKLRLKIPMEAGKGYSLTLPEPRQLPQICSILTEARVAVTPMGGSLRVGGTMELSGLNDEISPVRVRGIIDSFQRYFPEFTSKDFEGIKPWRGLRPCSPDGLPYVGRTNRFENLSIAAGHSMMGLSLGPITGKLISEILSGERPSHDLTILSPDRYN
jgi:D-amino-acid dehydrogenase